MIAKGKKIAECFEWLRERKAVSITDLFFYKEGEDGKILACAGLVICVGKKAKYAQIEPMRSESSKATYDVYHEIMNFLTQHGVKIAVAGSNVDEVKELLERRLDWGVWNEGVTNFIKKI